MSPKYVAVNLSILSKITYSGKHIVLRCEMRDLFVCNKLHSSFINCLTSSWYDWEYRQEMHLNWILSCFQNIENNRHSISNGEDYQWTFFARRRLVKNELQQTANHQYFTERTKANRTHFQIFHLYFDQLQNQPPEVFYKKRCS